MLHPYEYMSAAELHAYICGVIERTHGPLSTRAASLRREVAAQQRTKIIRTARSRVRVRDWPDRPE